MATDSWADIEQQLNAPNPRDWIAAWKTVKTFAEDSPSSVTPERLRSLLDRLWEQKDRDQRAWQTGVSVLLAVQALVAARAEGEADEGEACGSLGGWLWQPCRGPAMVAHSMDSKHRRDEDAVLLLARHLAIREFPHVSFGWIDLDNPEWQRLLSARMPECLVVVGRPTMYGPEAVEQLAVREPDHPLRFSFPPLTRPAGLKANEVDGRYHAIHELGRERPHTTSQDGHHRTDYCLVQRYPVRWNTQTMVVIVCAGASPLGTLTAVQWAAHTLLRPGLEGDPIPVPPKVTHESRLEALLEARGEIACYPHVWRPDRWDVKALYVDRWVWSDRDRAWYPIPPRVITVEQREDAEVTTVLFDGERARFRGEAPLTLRLLLRLCQLAHQAPGGRVEIAALAEGEEGLARIKPRLRQLKARHLGEAVALSDTHVTLRARVNFKAAAE